MHRGYSGRTQFRSGHVQWFIAVNCPNERYKIAAGHCRPGEVPNFFSSPHISTDIVLVSVVLYKLKPYKNNFQENKFAGKIKKSIYSYTIYLFNCISKLNVELNDFLYNPYWRIDTIG